MEITKLSKFVMYNPVAPSNTQKRRIVEIAEYPNAFNEQLICMDGEILFRRCVIKKDFESWKTSEKIIFQKQNIKNNWKEENINKFLFQQTIE